jgi:hypothetical protein
MRLYRKLFQYGLSKVEHGSLRVREEFPGGEDYVLGGKKPGYKAEIRIVDPYFYKHCVLYGEIGFGEGYVARSWETEDLNLALRYFAQNADCLPGFSGSNAGAWFLNILGFVNRIKHSLRPTTLESVAKISPLTTTSAMRCMSSCWRRLWRTRVVFSATNASRSMWRRSANLKHFVASCN